MADQVKHPAKFNDTILEVIANLLPAETLDILDPFAGTGKVHQLRAVGKARGLDWYTEGVEIEQEWANQHRSTFVGTALNLIGFPTYDAIVTSPCYGNRMADNYAGDGTPRHTYRIDLGRELSPGSSAGLQWGDKYRVFHRRAWAEATRVARPGGVFILNIKDHIRNGKVMPVTSFHTRTLRQLGWRETGRVEVTAPGQRHGANRELRMDYESVIRFELGVSF